MCVGGYELVGSGGAYGAGLTDVEAVISCPTPSMMEKYGCLTKVIMMKGKIFQYLLMLLLSLTKIQDIID